MKLIILLFRLIKLYKHYLILALSLSASITSKQRAHADQVNFTFPAMGTFFEVTIYDAEKSLLKPVLEDKILSLVFKYDRTFSDWNPHSELRNLEKVGLDQWHKPGKLFWQGLSYAKKLHTQTSSAFDITVGAILWKTRTQAVGLENLVLTDQRFRFKKDPIRLTFGGMVKGMVLGEIAQYLAQSGLENFHLNAGDGNLVFSGRGESAAWKEYAEIGEHDPNQIIFLSRSRTLQKNRSHIVNQQGHFQATARQVKIKCTSHNKNLKTWPDLGSYSDALSTALLLNPQISLKNDCVAIKI